MHSCQRYLTGLPLVNSTFDSSLLKPALDSRASYDVDLCCHCSLTHRSMAVLVSVKGFPSSSCCGSSARCTDGLSLHCVLGVVYLGSAAAVKKSNHDHANAVDSLACEAVVYRVTWHESDRERLSLEVLASHHVRVRATARLTSLAVTALNLPSGTIEPSDRASVVAPLLSPHALARSVFLIDEFAPAEAPLDQEQQDLEWLNGFQMLVTTVPSAMSAPPPATASQSTVLPSRKRTRPGDPQPVAMPSLKFQGFGFGEDVESRSDKLNMSTSASPTHGLIRANQADAMDTSSTDASISAEASVSNMGLFCACTVLLLMIQLVDGSIAPQRMALDRLTFRCSHPYANCD